MRVYISADMDGCSGVVALKHILYTEPEYQRARSWLMSDVNAAVRGAVAGGALSVLVNDAHGTMLNVVFDDLDPRAELISGNNKPDCMMAGLDKTFDAVMLVGYHAKDATPDAVVNHSYLYNQVREIRLNGVAVGEAGLNAAIAGYWGVPVVMVTGDDKAAHEVESLLPGVRTVVVKYGIDRFAARLLPLASTAQAIETAAAEVISELSAGKRSPLYHASSPVTIEIDFYATTGPKYATLFPTVQANGPTGVRIKHDDMLVAFRQAWGCMLLAMAGSGGTIR